MKAALNSFQIQKWELFEHGYKNLVGFEVFIKNDFKPLLSKIIEVEDFYSLKESTG